MEVRDHSFNNSVCIDVDSFHTSEDNSSSGKTNNHHLQEPQIVYNFHESDFTRKINNQRSKSSKCSAHFDEDELQKHDKLRLEKMDNKTADEQSSIKCNNISDDDSKSKHYVPRKSLLGKPIVARNYSRQDAQYRKLQSKIYNFLERPKNWQAVGYHILVFASVFTCLVLSVLSTIDDIGPAAGEFLFYVELSVLFWFFTEYCLRLWSAGCRSRYQTWRGRLQFAQQPFCLVDLIVIVASIIVLALGSDRQMFAASALRGLRFFQILRMIRMDRRGGSWKLLASVVWAHRQELFTTIYIGFLVLVFSSFLIYLVEKDEENNIKSYADALWWGVITLCTVGYGDTVPKTPLGKLIAGCCAIAGISFFALPAGILGSGFALKVQQHQRHKHLIRRRMPAANLIQQLWRCYSSDPNSTSQATWKPHTKSYLRTGPTDRQPPISANENSIFSSSMIAVDKLAKLSRLSTIKRRCEKLTGGSNSANSQITGSTPPHRINHSFSSSNLNTNSKDSDIIDEDILYNQKTKSKLKSDSQENLEDEDEDGEESSANRIEIGMGENDDAPIFPISRRNALSQPGEKNSKDEEKKKFGILDDFFLNRYTSVASMSREEHEEWESSNHQKRELTNSEKNAIRFIRKIKFFVAARKFKEALRPYDLKDIIEQYSSGHVDMLARIKGLQARLEDLFGRPDTATMNMSTRVMMIESRVENIESKLDKFLQLYTQNSLSANNHITYTPPIPSQIDQLSSPSYSKTNSMMQQQVVTFNTDSPTVIQSRDHHSPSSSDSPTFSHSPTSCSLPHTPVSFVSSAHSGRPSTVSSCKSPEHNLQPITSPVILYRKSDQV